MPFNKNVNESNNTLSSSVSFKFTIFMFAARGEQVQVDNATRAVHTSAAACITAEGRVFENVL